MTLQETIEFKEARLAYGLDAVEGPEPSVSDQIASINWAVRTIARHAFVIDPAVALTLTADTATYDMEDTSVVAKRIVRPFKVIINGNPIRTARGDSYGLWSLEEIERVNPAFRTGVSGRPVRATWHSGKYLFLDPKPTQTVVDAGNSFIEGQVMPADLTAGDMNAELPLAVDLHEAAAYLAAYRSAFPNATEAEQWQRLREAQAAVTASVTEAGKQGRDAYASWGTTTGARDYFDL